MAVVDWHASHEQVSPSVLLAAALPLTSLSFGVVNAPGQRYHPGGDRAGDRHPRRDVCGPVLGGAGQRRGEQRAHHQRRLAPQGRALLRGEDVSHDRPVTVDRARVWTRPQQPPLLIGAATSEKTAAWGADWADGLTTTKAPSERLRRIGSAYRDAGCGELHLQVHVSWAPDEREAEAIAYDQWLSNVFPPPVHWDLDSAEPFDAVSEQVQMENVCGAVNISADLGRQAALLARYAGLGFEQLYLRHVGQQQDRFIDAFGAKAPELRSAA
jgi:alkanesulfonate monooxygenase SsuD/methylene tetrahydromethanopterin reductase-like flavin-dependent oxidoreductase (luciferase family)